jgi:hypothetical protein
VLIIIWQKAACNFSLLAQRKVTKRKGPGCFAGFAGSLRFSESEGFSDGPSLARQRTRDIPVAPLRAIPPIPAMLGGVNGTKSQSPFHWSHEKCLSNFVSLNTIY